MEPSYAETPFSRLLFLWAAFHVSRIIDSFERAGMSMKPRYLAGQISADVAATGNPEGA